MNGRVFVDSNVFLYLHQPLGSPKTERVLDILEDDIFISPQVVFECVNVCLKKFKFSRQDSIVFANMLLDNCVLLEETLETTKSALSMMNKYQLQGFDSKILATALFHGCGILYSEDMQHGLVIENKLTIINPFLDK